MFLMMHCITIAGNVEHSLVTLKVLRATVFFKTSFELFYFKFPLFAATFLKLPLAPLLQVAIASVIVVAHSSDRFSDKYDPKTASSISPFVNYCNSNITCIITFHRHIHKLTALTSLNRHCMKHWKIIIVQCLCETLTWALTAVLPNFFSEAQWNNIKNVRK